MSDCRILCVDDATHRQVERSPAMAAISRLGEHYDLTIWPANGDIYEYSRVLRAVWSDPRTLINIEHDMAVRPSHVAALLACPHPLCAWVYWISPLTTGHLDVMLSTVELSDRSGWAERTAVGLCKIDREYRRGVFPVVNYHEVEGWVGRLCGGPWHLHYPPVPHYHGFLQRSYDAYADIEQAVAHG